MTVASCPSCQERVTVPVDATPDSMVRCPFCHEEFELRAFLTQLPPSLIVLEQGSSVEGGESNDATVEADASSSNVLGALVDAGEPRDSSDSLPAFDFTPEPVDKEEQREPAGPSKGRGQKNATVEAVKIVAGALLAIPAAQIILWWFVPGGYKRDLLGIGPAVSRVVPWVVPERFHARDEVSSSYRPLVSEPRRGRDTASRQRLAQQAESGSTRGYSEPAKKKISERQDARDSAGSDDENRVHPDVETVAPSRKSESRELPAATEIATEPGNRLVRGVRDAPQYSLSQLQAALEAAMQASIAWDADADQGKKRRGELTDQFYQAFARLSEAVTYPPPNNPGTQELVGNLSGVLKTFANQPRKLAMIGNQTVEWLDRSTRPTEGVFMFGTVREITGTGRVYETKLELAALEKRLVTVVSRVDPRRTFAAGDRILMLGAIVDQPERNLLGYEGNDARVVMGGFPVLLR